MEQWAITFNFLTNILYIVSWLIKDILIPGICMIAPEIIFFVVIILIIEVIAWVRGEIITKDIRTIIWAICCVISFVISFV